MELCEIEIWILTFSYQALCQAMAHDNTFSHSFNIILLYFPFYMLEKLCHHIPFGLLNSFYFCSCGDFASSFCETSQQFHFLWIFFWVSLPSLLSLHSYHFHLIFETYLFLWCRCLGLLYIQDSFLLCLVPQTVSELLQITFSHYLPTQSCNPCSLLGGCFLCHSHGDFNCGLQYQLDLAMQGFLI